MFMKTHTVKKSEIQERWYIVDEIPRTSSGKVNRATVAERCAVRAPVEIRKLLARRPASASEGA